MSRHRWLILLVAVLAVATTAQTTGMVRAAATKDSGAAGGTVTQEQTVHNVHVMIEGAHGLDIEETVDVTPMSYRTSDGKREVMADPTALGALLRALSAAGVTDDRIQATSFGDYVSRVAGQSEKTIDPNTGWSFWVNGQLPSTGATDTKLKDGDQVVWAFADWQQTLYPAVKLSATSLDPGQTLTATVTATKVTYDAQGNAKTTTVPLQGATVHFGEQSAVTLADGTAVWTAGKHGTYPVWVGEQRADGLPLVIHSVPQSVTIAPHEADIHLRAVGYKGTLFDGSLNVGPETATDDQGHPITMTEPTALGALSLAAQEKGLPLTVKSSSYGPYVSSFAGETEKDINGNTGWFAVINGASATTSLDQIQLHDGDSVVVYFGDATKTLWPSVRVSTTTAAFGAPVGLTVTADTYDANWNLIHVPVHGATVHAGAQTTTTDASGNTNLVMTKSGDVSVTVGQEDAQSGLPLVVDSEPVTIHVSNTPVAIFHDLPASRPSHDAIVALANEGVVVGDGTGHYRPAAPVTRAEMAKMLVDAFHLPMVKGVATFSDVPSDAWYAPYVEAVNAAGWMVGDDHGAFVPSAPINREQLAVVVDRISGSIDDPLTMDALGSTGQLPYKDASSTDSYALPWVKVALNQPGYQSIIGSTLAPKSAVTRTDAAMVIHSLQTIVSK